MNEFHDDFRMHKYKIKSDIVIFFIYDITKRLIYYAVNILNENTSLYNFEIKWILYIALSFVSSGQCFDFVRL